MRCPGRLSVGELGRCKPVCRLTGLCRAAGPGARPTARRRRRHSVGGRRCRGKVGGTPGGGPCFQQRPALRAFAGSSTGSPALGSAAPCHASCDGLEPSVSDLPRTTISYARRQVRMPCRCCGYSPALVQHTSITGCSPGGGRVSRQGAGLWLWSSTYGTEGLPTHHVKDKVGGYVCSVGPACLVLHMAGLELTLGVLCACGGCIAAQDAFPCPSKHTGHCM